MAGTGGQGAGGTGGARDYPTANPFLLSPGGTQGSCPPGFACTGAPALGNVCTERDGSSRVCIRSSDCGNYGPDAICQFTPTLIAYCFQSCTP